jgi:hypothetical protein
MSILNAKLIRVCGGYGNSELFLDKTGSCTILYDTQTNLYWQDDADSATIKNYWGWLWTSDPREETKTWWEYIYGDSPSCPPIDGANKECFCKASPYRGYWRVPTYNELNSILDRSAIEPHATIKKEFKNVSNGKYWTSTTYAEDTSKAWHIDFSNGDSDILSKSTSLYVRCVH